MKRALTKNNQKGLLAKRIGLLLTIVVFMAFGYYIATNKEELRSLLSINPLFLILIFIAQLSMIFTNGIFIKIILEPFKKYIATKEAFYVSILSTVGNFFAPVGAGFGFRAVYLKKRHDLSYSNYFSTLSGNYIIVFLVTSVFGLLGMILLGKELSYQAMMITAVFMTLLFFSLLLMIIKPNQIPQVSNTGFVKKVTSIIIEIVRGWAYVAAHKRLLLKLIILTTVNLLLAIAVLFFITTAFSMHVSLAALLLLGVLGSLSLFINITPGNLGVKEAVFIFSSSVLGLTTNDIILIALVDRGVMFITLALLWLYSLRIRKTQKFKIIN